MRIRRQGTLSAIAGAAGMLAASGTHAQVVLSQSSFEAGVNFAAFFRVERGCGASPTQSLRIEIPPSVTVLQVPPKPGWTVDAERAEGRVKSVTWRGRLEADRSDQFGLFVKLPAQEGALYFPTVQRCAAGEIRWADVSASGRQAAHPAPRLTLIAAASQAHAHHDGPVAIEQPWARATPPGAATAAAYFRIVNHGTAADTLVGGSTPAAAKLEIHQMSMANGIMTMRPVTGGVTVPAGGTVEFGADGGYHLMLTGLKTPLRVGTVLSATLMFAEAGAIEVAFPVEAIGARGPSAAPAAHDHH